MKAKPRVYLLNANGKPVGKYASPQAAIADIALQVQRNPAWRRVTFTLDVYVHKRTIPIPVPTLTDSR